MDIVASLDAALKRHALQQPKWIGMHARRRETVEKPSAGAWVVDDSGGHSPSFIADGICEITCSIAAKKTVSVSIWKIAWSVPR